MGPLYEIAVDAGALTITVGPKTFDRPLLRRMAERDASVKAEILNETHGEAPWDLGLKAAYQFYAKFLGAKFNRRFQAANYWLWLGNRFTARTGNMLRIEGRHWRAYHEGLVWRTKEAGPYISEAEADGLFNLIPLIVAFKAAPATIRKQIGGAAWRRIAHGSISRNCRIMHAIQRARTTEDVTDPALVERLVEFPSGVLRAVQGAKDEEVIAARITHRKTVEAFQATVHLVSDTKRMLGAAFNPAWGLSRMEREHHDAVRELASKKFSSRNFAEPWAFERDGFTATLLTSELDIATEGATQHHCVASYAKQSARGNYVVFRIEGKERATAGYRAGKSLATDQVYGACNSRVSDDCEAFAHFAKLAFERARRESRDAA